MQPSTLRLGAFAGIVTLVMTLVSLPFAFVTSESAAVLKAITVAGTLLDIPAAVVFLVILGQLLGRHVGIPRVEGYLVSFVVVYAIAALLVVVSLYIPLLELAIGVLSVIAVIAMGILFILAGTEVNRWQGNIWDLGTALGTTALVTGILFVTVLGALFGLIGLIVWTVFGIMVLFRAASHSNEESPV